MTNRVLGGVSLSAIVALAFPICLASEASAQVSQTTQAVVLAQEQSGGIDQTASEPATEGRNVERVIVTGTNIRATAESAALPVEVLSAEDTFVEGGQNALEFIKSLSIVGATTGESNQFGGSEGAIGFTNVNLRGLGGGRTLTVFNGRRTTENTSFIPQIALDRTEILKDGGAVIYGADATGGVVNFITRDDFEGVLVDGQHKFITGSAGDSNLAAMWGKNFGQSNLLVSFEYMHRSELDLTDRPWSIRPYEENSTPYTPYHNYSAYQLNTATGPDGLVVDFTEDDCLNSNGLVPGYYSSLSGVPVCWWNWTEGSFNLVEDQDLYRAYTQLDTDLSNTLSFRAWVAYGKSQVDEFGNIPALPVNIGPAPTSGGAFQLRIPRANPAFDVFLQQNANQIDPSVLPNIVSADQFLSIVFGPSGAPHQERGEGSGSFIQLENFNVAAEFNGDLYEVSGGWLDTWSLAGNYNHASSAFGDSQDLLGFRIQEALNGFGGPNCNAEDLVPDAFTTAALDANNDGTVSKEEFYAVVGTQNPAAAGQNGCLWFNPFSSSYATHFAFDQENNRYVAGFENSPELSRWFYLPDGQGESLTQTLTIDALLTGAIQGFELPGGQLGWALGGQWLQAEFDESDERQFQNPELYPCAWPGQQIGQVGCPALQGPYIFTTPGTLDHTDQQQYSYFGELQVPVLDNLSLQLAARREEFPYSGLGATVWKVAGKWDPLDWLAIRASFGTNYSTPPINFVPGEVTSGIALVAAAGNRYLRGITQTLPEVRPETAEVGNAGFIMQFDNGLPLDGALRISADYFNFEIIDEIKTVSHNQILGTTFVAGQSPGANSQIDCSAALIGRIEFVNGIGAAGCTQGATTGNDVLAITSVRGNGPGLKTSGIDYDVQYAFSALDGEVNLGLTATQILTAEVSAFTLNGVQLSPNVDALGFTNYSRDGELVSEWRGNVFANYNWGNHNIRYAFRYTSGITDDRVQFAVNGQLFQVDAWATHNLYYQYIMPFDEDLTLSLSVENLLDDDPPFTQQQLSYDPLFANPLGRTFEIGIRKQF